MAKTDLTKGLLSRFDRLQGQREKRTYKKAIDHSNDITFENEVKKPEVIEVKETVSETKAEAKSSLTFGE